MVTAFAILAMFFLFFEGDRWSLFNITALSRFILANSFTELHTDFELFLNSRFRSLCLGDDLSRSLARFQALVFLRFRAHRALIFPF